MSVEAANKWRKDRQPVLAVEVGDRARAYPVQTLIWHEIVNDRLDGRAIAVTYCPLCNTSLVFDRRVDSTGFDRVYGANPYQNYDDPDSDPVWLEGEPDGRLPPKERVVAIKARMVRSSCPSRAWSGSLWPGT